MPKVAPAPVPRDAAPHAARPIHATARRHRTRAWGSVAPVLAVVAPFAVAYVVLALVLPLPVIYQDEGFYQHLARSLAHGDGFTWRDTPIALRSALYVYVISPVWLVASGVRAWEIAKVETALLSCLVAVPVWLLARELVSHRLALLTVALSLSGTWMAGSGSLMTESVGLPLATASLAVTVQALRRPSSRLPWLALLLALLAAWARIQLVVLVPAIFAALLLDVARSGRHWRSRVRRHRAPLLAMGILLALAVVVAVVNGPGAIGGYSAIARLRPDVSWVLRASGYELLHLAALCGVLPLVLLGALVLRRAAWTDDVVGPLLAVLLPSVAVFTLENGFYIGGVEGLWPIERYIIYVAPLLLVLTVAAIAREGVVRWWTWLAAALLSVPLMWMREVAERSEQRAAFATIERLRDLWPQMPAGTAMLVVGLAVCVLAAMASGLGRRRGLMAPAVVGSILLTVLLMQTATVMAWQMGVERTARTALPADRSWVDHHSHGPVSVLQVTGNAGEFALLDFFNARISRVYAYNNVSAGPMLQGGICGWRLSPAGVAEFAPGCAPPSHEFLINDPTGHLLFYDEVASSADPRIGRLVTVRPPLRVKAALVTPCGRPRPVEEPITLRVVPGVPQPCGASLTAATWLRHRGRVIVTVRGAPSDAHMAVVDGLRHDIPAGKTIEIAVPVGRGRSDVTVDFDWAARGAAFPLVTRVALEQDGRREPLV
jgi:hypothetical protein